MTDKLNDPSRWIVNGKYTSWQKLYEDNEKLARWLREMMAAMGAAHLHACAIADAYNAWDSTRKKNVFFKGPDLDIAHTLNQILLLTKGYDQIAKETKSDDVVVTTKAEQTCRKTSEP